MLESAIDINQIPDLASLRTITAEFGFLDYHCIGDLVQSVLAMFLLDRHTWAHLTVMLRTIQDKGSLFECDQEIDQSPFFKDPFALFNIA